MMVRYFLIGMTRLYGWLVMMLAHSGTAMAQAVSVPNPPNGLMAIKSKISINYLKLLINPVR